MKVHFLSDLHITSAEDPWYRRMLDYLDTRVTHGDHVVFGGDVFDLFVCGRKREQREYSDWIKRVKAFPAKGVAVDLLEGNHDFDWAPIFAGVSGIRMGSHENEVVMDGHRIVFAHGDLIDRKDWRYLGLRAFLRALPTRLLLRGLPESLFQSLARLIESKSRGEASGEFGRLPIERQQSLRKCYRSWAALKIQNGADVVLVGHCHDLDEMKFKVGDRAGVYFNAGYPRVHDSFVVWDSLAKEVSRVPI